MKSFHYIINKPRGYALGLFCFFVLKKLWFFCGKPQLFLCVFNCCYLFKHKKNNRFRLFIKVKLVTSTEFESVNAAVKGQCVKPLHQLAMLIIT